MAIKTTGNFYYGSKDWYVKNVGGSKKQQPNGLTDANRHAFSFRAVRPRSK